MNNGHDVQFLHSNTIPLQLITMIKFCYCMYCMDLCIKSYFNEIIFTIVWCVLKFTMAATCHTIEMSQALRCELN